MAVTKNVARQFSRWGFESNPCSVSVLAKVVSTRFGSISTYQTPDATTPRLDSWQPVSGGEPVSAYNGIAHAKGTRALTL